ncbi:MAG: efflux RND transporter permease subunit [Calditrichaeota bacterium]|nr:MAG: efflux RND transporter permease subunit [Calditrichota bacterium]
MFFSNTVLVLQKAVTATAALLLAFFKFVLTLLLLPALPLVALARILRLTEFEMGPWLAAFAERPAFLRVRFVENLWPTFLVIGSVPAFLADLRGMGQGLREAGWKRRVLRAGVLPFKSAFALLKFLFQFALELSFRFLHVLFVLGGVFFKWGVLQIRLVFSPLAQLVTGAFNRAYARLEAAYPRLLQRALARRGTTLGVVAALFLFCILILAPRLGSELIPEVHQGEFNVEVTMPVGTPVEKTDAKLLEIEKLIADQPGVDKVAAVSGTDRTANTTSEEGEHTAKLTVRMKRASSVVREEEELVERIRELMSNFSGIQWKISRPVLFSFKTPVEVEIQGYNLQELQRFSRELEEKMREIPGVFDVESNIQRGNPEVQIVYNRDVLSKLGLNIRDVAAIVRNKVRGDVATEFKEQDRQIDILVRLQERDRESIEDLRRLVINPGAPKPIPLEAVAAIRVEEGPSEIRRVDQQRTAVVTANISGRDLRSVSEDIYAVLRGMDLPPDFTYRLAGQNQEMETSLNSLKLALALAIFLVYIVMASQFESVIHPLVIIFTIPLALIGVIIALFLLQIPLSIVVFLGMIMLAGIVVNNAIVLVDYINKLRERGMAKMEAIVEAGKVRLRPIMMTTATTVLGLLPMALGLGDGAEIRTPMAITVIVGLLSATVLTLVIIPTVYSLVDRRN